MELPHVSTRVWERIPTAEETVEAMHVILTEHNFTRALFLGHSYGTACTCVRLLSHAGTINVAWAMKLRPQMVRLSNSS